MSQLEMASADQLGNCNQLMFENQNSQADQEVIITDAVRTWWDGNYKFDWFYYTPNDPIQENLGAYDFSQLVWKDTTKVAAGFGNGFVVAWFCDDQGNQPLTKDAF